MINKDRLISIEDFVKHLQDLKAISSSLQERMDDLERIADTIKSGADDHEGQGSKPQDESLFGRWATHTRYGRGIITTDRPDPDGTIEFTYDDPYVGIQVDYSDPEDLDIDPVTLTARDDFDGAPNGTIVEDYRNNNVYVKAGGYWYMPVGTNAFSGNEMCPCRVVRWGPPIKN